MRWVFVGSSPIAPDHVASVLPRLRPCTTITCNAAIKLFDPDVYFLADQVACRRYSRLAKAAKERGPVHLVTMKRDRPALEMRNVQWFDEFLQNGVDPPQTNRWGAYNMSGAVCLEYACRHGATELHLLGCEGYADGAAYFDQHERDTEFRTAGADSTPHLVTRTTMVVECFHHVQFYAYGPLRYSIPLPNWHESITV